MLRILNADADQISLGSDPYYRNVGVISIAVMTPEGIGSATAKGYCDALSAIFRSAQFSGILCRTPRIEEVGNMDGYYQIQVITEFQRDETF